jgi:hypothetical protein
VNNVIAYGQEGRSLIPLQHIVFLARSQRQFQIPFIRFAISVRLSACHKSGTDERIFVNYDIWKFTKMCRSVLVLIQIG